MGLLERVLSGWLSRKGEAAAAAQVPAGVGAQQSGQSPRARRRRGPPYQRSFDAANVDRLTSDWTTTPLSSDQVLFAQLTRLRARSRQQVASNPYARKFVLATQVNVVGPNGIKLQVVALDPDGTVDKLGSRAVEDDWEQWSTERACDAAGKLPWPWIQNLVMSTVARDGEFFALKRWGQKYGRWNYALRPVDAEQIPVDYNTKLKNGNIVRMGVEMDLDRRPVAYYMREEQENPAFGYTTGSRNLLRVPADQMLHAFIPFEVGQTRGCPLTATALYRLRMLGAYEDAALVAARMGAAQMAVIEEAPDGRGYVGEEETELDYEISAEPGTFPTIPHGSKMTPFNPDYPRGEYPEFQRAMLRGIAAGLFLCYPSLAQDLSQVSYSSIRQGLLEERDYWKLLQSWLAFDICQPCYNDWLRQQLSQERIRVGKGVLSLDREEKFRRVQWRGRRWQWVDPQTEMAAAQIAIDQKITSRGAVIRDLTQEDPEDVWGEIEREMPIIDKLSTGNAEAV